MRIGEEPNAFTEGEELMKEEPDMRFFKSEDEEPGPPPPRNQAGIDKKKIPFVIAAVFLVILLAAGAVYLLSTGENPPREEEKLAQSRLQGLEQKITAMEKQIEELNTKILLAGRDDLGQRVKELAHRLDALEKKGKPPAAKPKTAAIKSADPKPAALPQKQFHTVRKGETLTSLGKKYKVSVSELRKLNHLSENQAIYPGQRLLVSTGR